LHRVRIGFGQCLKYLWASPCSAIGLVLAGVPCLFGASARLHSGVLEIAFADPRRALARMLLRLPFAGITFGHVVLAPTRELQDALRAHERAHVAQYEAWGPAFLIAYPLSSLVQVLCGRRAHADNHFEVQARARQGRWASPCSGNESVDPGAARATSPPASVHATVDGSARAARPV
jgi:hypothetical protein